MPHAPSENVGPRNSPSPMITRLKHRKRDHAVASTIAVTAAPRAVPRVASINAASPSTTSGNSGV